ncbi:FAD-linked oxidoreductase-like protein [Crepidotus variabilis]|uniref:Proline dehydrogenase n=1 Tax=Crepidotus variabilis TaxID=179855 RepID=A0A9P6JR32_9AGAR|nr:FAD-linked oxidoreductase-like protein [Crepidotus variabilis]
MIRTTLRPLLYPRTRSQVIFPTRKFASATTSARSTFLTRRILARTTLATLITSSIALGSKIYADEEESTDVGEDNLAKPSLSSMIRAYFVFSLCSMPWLVDHAPDILQTLSGVPIIKQVTEGVVRVTFFKHFVGAETADQCIPLLRSLRQENKGALFAYSVEVDERQAIGTSTSSASIAVGLSESPHKRIVQEIMHCVDVAADFEADISHDAVQPGGKRTWIAVKLTALLPDANALIALSSWIVNSRKSLPRSAPESAVPFPGAARMEDLKLILHPSTSKLSKDPLSPEHLRQLKELYNDLVRICTRAKDRGIKVIIDAEYSWYQPAIDAFTLSLMREFNSSSPLSFSIQPLVYGTFQAYLRRTPSHLAVALADAKSHKYALGIKLVRGAYHPHEIAAHQRKDELSISPDREPPVWTEKKDTDEAYDQCVKILLSAVKEDVNRSKRTSINRVVQEWYADWFGVSTNAQPISHHQAAARSIKTTNSLPRIGILFGTHNWKSCNLIIDEIVRNGLGYRVVSRTSTKPNVSGNFLRLDDDVVDRLAIGQLYGMGDSLSNWIASRTVSNTPLLLKYIPYGALADVMPYLSRRAIENKSILGEGGAADERRRAGKEIRQRVFW